MGLPEDRELIMSNSKDGSRKNMSRRMAVTSTALAFVAAASTAVRRASAQQKITQAAAQYQAQPKGNQSCATCVNFQPSNACKFVEGTISPTAWCVLFAPKP
jgi:hypothetical protein